MTRLNAVLVAAGLAVGASGCAHCDTCDDFPAPCVGPNCGGQYGAYGTGNQPMPDAGPTTMAPTSGASLGPVIDGAGPAPTVPGGTGAAPAAPAVNPGIESKPGAPAGGSTPPAPTDPFGPRPTRPGA